MLKKQGSVWSNFKQKIKLGTIEITKFKIHKNIWNFLSVIFLQLSWSILSFGIGIDDQDFRRILMLLRKYKFDSTENTSFCNGDSANSKKCLQKLILAFCSP